VNGKIITQLNVEELYYPEVYLYSILTNLITNSIKYSAEQPLKIIIHSFRENDRVYLEFMDNGIGIDLEKHRDKLFKPFQRFTEKSEGKGIGLSIISHLIAKNGGNLSIESEPGQGCKFICCLIEYDKLSVSPEID
jgi:signal transduction histidine kinase